MDNKALLGIIAAALLAGGILGGSLNQDKPIYQCSSKNLLSNCFKLGAENTRCYYNETAPLKYINCPEGWHIITSDSVNPENSGTSDVLIKEFNNCFKCQNLGCSLC